MNTISTAMEKHHRPMIFSLMFVVLFLCGILHISRHHPGLSLPVRVRSLTTHYGLAWMVSSMIRANPSGGRKWINR